MEISGIYSEENTTNVFIHCLHLFFCFWEISETESKVSCSSATETHLQAILGKKRLFLLRVPEYFGQKAKVLCRCLRNTWKFFPSICNWRFPSFLLLIWHYTLKCAIECAAAGVFPSPWAALQSPAGCWGRPCQGERRRKSWRLAGPGPHFLPRLGTHSSHSTPQRCR